MSDTLSITVTALVFSVFVFAFATATGVSQLCTMYKTKNTSGTSIATYIIFIVCATFSLCWGYVYYFANIGWYLEHQSEVPFIIWQFSIIPMIATYTIEFVGLIFQCILKAKHIQLAKKQHVTELQLSKTLLAQAKNNKHRYTQLIIILVIITVVSVGANALLLIFTNPSINPNVPILNPNEAIKAIIITLSVIGAALWEAISWPQFVKCIKTKDTSGISMVWAVALPISCAISLVYALILATSIGGFTFDTIGAIIFNGLVVNTGILIIKVINRSKAKKLNMSEIEYTRKHIYKKEKRA